MKTKLREIRDSKKLTRDAVAKMAGITSQQLYNIENDRSEINLSTALKLCGIYEIKNIADILPDNFFTDVNSLANFDSFQNKRKVYMVPAISCDDIATRKELVENINHLETLKKVSGNAFAIVICDKLATSRFLEGDFVIVDPEQMPEFGDYCLVDLDIKGLKLLTLTHQSNGEYHFLSNGAVKFSIPEKNKEKIIGKIVDFIGRI